MAESLQSVTTATDPYSTVVLAKAPVGYWRLGESSGPTAADSSTNLNNGTYFGSPNFGEPGAIANSSNTAVGLRGHGSGDYIEIPAIGSASGRDVDGRYLRWPCDYYREVRYVRRFRSGNPQLGTLLRLWTVGAVPIFRNPSLTVMTRSVAPGWWVLALQLEGYLALDFPNCVKLSLHLRPKTPIRPIQESAQTWAANMS